MATLIPTATSVEPYDDASLEQGIAGEDITAGQSLYKSNAGQIMKADADTQAQADSVGISMCGASRKQPVVYARAGRVDVGATLTIGTVYAVAADTAGGICPIADLGSGDWPTILGIAEEADVLKIQIQRITEPKA